MIVPFNFETDRINRIILNNKTISELQFLESEINEFLLSKRRLDMIKAEQYMLGNQDILRRKRTIIGKDGNVEIVDNLPNNKIVDNQYTKVVEQKCNYLLSKKITFSSKNKEFVKEIEQVCDSKFLRTIKNIGEDSINYGIAWLYVYFDEYNQIKFKRFRPYEILPFWADEEHTELDMVVRIHPQITYTTKKEIITKVIVYKKTKIEMYVLDNNKLILEDIEPYSYNNMSKIPIISFKANNKEISMINRIKTLQDALNTLRSDFMNNMQEDARNTILVLKNYDGTNLGEFRKNLAEYGVVKVKSIEGSDGGVETLKIEVDSSNYQIIIDMIKKAIIENARGFDCKDERMSNNPNRLNIQSMYSDIDLDANSMELEFKASFQDLIYFINIFLELSNKGSFFDEKIEVIFNKDQLINESEVIENCKSSKGILSDETIVANHPWTENLDEELKKIEKENSFNIPKNDYPNRHLEDGGYFEK